MKKILIYLLFLAPAALWFTGIIAAPFLEAEESSFSDLLYFIYSDTCHQRPERSFSAFGYPYAVCARCTGIYLGFLLSALVYPLVRRLDDPATPTKHLLILSLIPLALDGGLQLITGYESDNFRRLMTGLFFGSALPYYLFPVFYEFVSGFLAPERQ